MGRHGIQPRTETNVLGPWIRSCAEVWGAPPELQRAASGDVTDVIQLPELVDEWRKVPNLRPTFGASPAIAAHVQRLGFEWDDAGRLTQVPTPGAFAAAVEEVAPGSGFELAYRPGLWFRMPVGRWFEGYLRGCIYLHLPVPTFYRSMSRVAKHDSEPRSRILRWWSPRAYPERLAEQVLDIIHDLTTHALPAHLVPRSVLADMGRRIERRMGWRVRLWISGIVLLPLPLQRFYENDLPNYCEAVERDRVTEGFPANVSSSSQRRRDLDGARRSLRRSIRSRTEMGGGFCVRSGGCAAGTVLGPGPRLPRLTSPARGFFPAAGLGHGLTP